MVFQSNVVPRQRLANFFLPVVVMAVCLTAQSQVTLTQISSDPYTNTDSQHATEVEASTFFNGNTIVTAFQQGRYENNGGASDVGFATSTDGGTTWTAGSLPGLTLLSGGTTERASDPAVAYDAKHDVWMISSLPVCAGGCALHPVMISRSTDGGLTWNDPITFGPTYARPDKSWLSCDNNTGSPYYGNCYAEWDNNALGDIVWFSVSSDGGLTFSTPVQPSGKPADFGMQPLSQPNGTVIAVGASATDSEIEAVTSTDGGATYTANVNVASIISHHANGLLRDLVLPTSAIDAAGTVYTVWQDCRFYSVCNANNLVMSTSSDGVTWSAVTRIPINPGSQIDVFLPGLAIEPGTSGSTAHLGLTFYFYAQRACGVTTCDLEEGYVSSTDGGATWSALTTLAGGMNNIWFPTTNQGYMPGDYESLAFVNGAALPVFGVATSRVKGGSYNVTMNVPTTPLTDGVAVYGSAGAVPVPGAHSDSPPRTTPVCDNCDDKD